MKKTNLRAILGAFVLALVLTSCASTPKKAPATLTKTESRAFWRIDGTDKNGNPSTVYIQGTFHLGDERIFPLSEEVQQAFVNSDRYAGEISTQGYADLAQLGPVLNAPNKDGKLVTDHLTEEEKAFVQMAFGENITIVDPLEPWQIKTGLSVLIYTNTGLSAEYGLDNSFIATLSQMGREWDGLDELQVQLDIITYGDYDTQIKMLKDIIKVFTDEAEAEKLTESTVGLYESYVNDDMKEMERLLIMSDEDEEASDKLYVDYHNMVFRDRNKEWAQDITNYLNEGGTTFIFAGCGHWLGPDSTFKFLKKMKTIK